MAPHPSALLNDHQRELADEVRGFADARLQDPDLRRRDAEGEFWREGWQRCAEFGLCGLPGPEDHGGGGADRLTTAAALEALGYGCPDAGLVFSLSAHLWTTVVTIARFGSAAQRARWLPSLCAGQTIGLHAMTEPGSGSDAFALTTSARREGDGWVLKGRKALITNAPVGGLIVVFARKPGTTGALGISAFLVDAQQDGVVVDQPGDKLGLRTSPMAELVFDDVAVPAGALLGREGRGAMVFAESMSWERCLIMSSQLGALRRSIDETIGYAREREQFGRPIAGFQAVADPIVETSVRLEAARALLFETAARFDRGEAGDADAAAVKLLASEVVLDGALAMLQVHGGYGFLRDLPLERRLRDAVGGRLYSGTSELMRRVVARSLGLE